MDDNQNLTYEKLLGEGAYGKVYLVKQEDGEKFAVKEIDLGKCDDPGRDQALKEAELLSRLSHGSILKYVESVVNEDCLYIVTEYCDGGDIEDYLQACACSGCTIPESLASDWIYQLGSALNHLHKKKILHRDMKTKNVFLKKDLTVKLGDLGIAKVLDLNQSKADTFIGTPAYMSPELFSGQPYNHKTDIWGLGCCAYEILTFRRAFEGKALWALVKEIREGKELELPPTYSLELRCLVQDMMSQLPEDRPSASDIVANTYLLYHKGKETKDVQHLPVPGEERKKPNRTGAQQKGSSGKMSSSLKSMLESKREMEEEKYRQSIAGVLEKINTLRMSHRADDTVDSQSTFIYKGYDEDDVEGTMKDVSTFIYHGEDEEQEGESSIVRKKGLSQKPAINVNGSESDSDYATDVVSPQFGERTLVDTESTLLQQYTDQLETLEDDQTLDVEDDSGRGPSPVWPKHVEEMLNRKPSHKLKDTFQVMEIRKARDEARGKREKKTDDKSERHREVAAKTPGGGKKPVSSAIEQSVQNGDVRKKKSRMKVGMSLSASFSEFSGKSLDSKSSDTKPRLIKTLSLEEDSPQKGTKSKSRPVQSKPTGSQAALKPRKKKEAFIEVADHGDAPHLERTDVSVQEVVQHLRSHLSPYIEEDSDEGEGVDDMAQTLKSRTGPQPRPSQEPPSRRKKEGVLKKYSGRSSVDKDQAVPKAAQQQSTDDKVTLFTRAQAVTFTKEEDSEEELLDVTTIRSSADKVPAKAVSEKKANGEPLNVTAILQAPDQLRHIQQELVKGIGLKNLQTAMEIMNMVQDENEMKAHLTNIIGPKLYEAYRKHFVILQILESGNLSNETTHL